MKKYPRKTGHFGVGAALHYNPDADDSVTAHIAFPHGTHYNKGPGLGGQIAVSGARSSAMSVHRDGETEDQFKISDRGTIKSVNTHQTGFHTDDPPAVRMCINMTSNPQVFNLGKSAHNLHLQKVVLYHWSFSDDILDTVTSAAPVGPIRLIFKDDKESHEHTHIAESLLPTYINLPWNLNTNESHTTSPPNEKVILVYSSTASASLQKPRFDFRSSAGNPLSFTFATLSLKLYPTQWWE